LRWRCVFIYSYDASGPSLPGQYLDEETGLYQNYFRDYDPEIGRYIESDPVGLNGGVNTYGYVGGNPVNAVDPLGLYPNTAQTFCMRDPITCAEIFGDMIPKGKNNTPCDTGDSGALASLADGIATAVDIISSLRKGRLPSKKGKKPNGKKPKGDNDSPCPLSCFVAGTEVLTEDGYKNIEDIKEGDIVFAKNVETGESEWKEVTNTWIVENREIYQISLSTSTSEIQTIDSTSDHPFYVLNKGWVETVDLVNGDLVEVKDGEPLIVKSVVKTGRKDMAYNFSVDDFHTYYVTKRDVLVHNCGRNGARNNAKRDAGIPSNQQPNSVNRVPLTDKNGKVILDENGRPVMTREYNYTRTDGSTVVIQDHGAGHNYGQGGIGDQGPHFNVRPSTNTRTGKVPGTRPHYPWGG